MYNSKIKNRIYANQNDWDIIPLIKDHPTILFNNLISPNKLIEGGAAILHDLNQNHHKAILGIKFIKPLLIINHGV